ncbi:MAG: isoquinoline 1-oxidoreductase [Planctomycetes bacterium]|nr:isoquinoline 1-oxidoreductase [Planctomycetota bacterium]
MATDSSSRTREGERSTPVRARDLGVPLSRRTFAQMLGAGLLVSVIERCGLGQQRGSRESRGAVSIAARLQINQDGTIRVMTGKVEEGQGARAQLTQAAAEELRVDVATVRLVMADTELVPDDGITAGSRTTPSTVPAVRRGAAAARELLLDAAARRWNVERTSLTASGGAITDTVSRQTIRYADLVKSPEVAEALRGRIPDDVPDTPVDQWAVMGCSVARPNIRDLVTGAHRYPSDIARPNMLYGKILRPPAYGATLESVDLSVAEGLPGVVLLRDGSFVGVAASSTLHAERALDAVAATAKWNTVPQIASGELFSHLKSQARGGRPQARGSVDEATSAASKVLSESYRIAFVQHAPMEPRAATAEWEDGKLTVWAGVDGPHRVQQDLARALGIPAGQVRVIVPDMGGGFGGKHTGEAAEEAARLSRAAGRPVAVHWTRAEEFTWAYFRPAAVIDCQGALDSNGRLVAWEFTNINAGGAAIDTPYAVPNTRILSAGSESPLRQGAYRCLAATANNFARESFMDELASAAGADPLEFRLAHLDNPRLRKVLEVAAAKFQWAERRKAMTPGSGVGLACGTEKNSVVAACVDVTVDRNRGELLVREVCEAFECGPIQNPANLLSQVQGCVIMGMGPALWEAIEFADGRILNASFAAYRVPRFLDVPRIDVHLVNNAEIPSAGGGETPIMAVAPAIANAVHAATGLRIRSMPLRDPRLREA